MKAATYVDEDGRQWAVQIPDDTEETEENIRMGLPLGPPSLEPLGLPKEVEVRLHNALFDRQLLTAQDIRHKRQAVFGAIQAAFKVDTEKVVQLYNSVGD